MGTICSFMRRPEPVKKPEPARKEADACPVIDIYKSPKTRKKISQQEKSIIMGSWGKVMEQSYENCMIIFLALVTKYPDYKKAHELADKSDIEIATESQVKHHLMLMATCVYDIISSLDNSERMAEITSDIKKYNKQMKLPASSTVDFKNLAIKFMLYKGFIDKKGEKIWHKALDDPMASLLCDC